MISRPRANRTLRTGVLLLAIPGSLCGGALAQQPAAAPAAAAPAQNGPPDPKLKLSPEKQLEQFEPPADAEYTLGPGDEININVTGHPDLSTKYTVGPDGRISLPTAGAVDLTDKTRRGAAEAIQEALTPYFTDVAVTLSIDKYGSNHVNVIGLVKNPGLIYFDSTPTLLEAISKAGLSANPTSKDGIPDTCIIYRGNNQQVEVNLRSLLQNGNMLANMRLRRGDTVFIPPQKQLVISVLGQVNHPGPVTLTPEMTLHLALSEAGGLTDEAGNNAHISIIQASTGKTITISYKEMMTPNGDKEISLHEGDIIAVPKSGFSKVGGVIQKLSPVATMVTLGALL